MILEPIDLKSIGWNDELEAALAAMEDTALVPARVAVSHGRLGLVWTREGIWRYAAAGRLKMVKGTATPGLPAVGDWVAVRPTGEEDPPSCLIEAMLPRKTAFWRKAAGNAPKQQVVAANMDTIFVVSSMNRDFNVRRIERYLSLARESGAGIAIVLTKADLARETMEGFAGEIREVAGTVPVHFVSVVSGEGMDGLQQYLQPGCAVALLGSSGVGKSSLINYWLGEERMRVNEIRIVDDRGRHTTTHRELLMLPGGALVIDTPGMRELQLLDHREGVQDAFEDIGELAAKCRFGNCGHSNEPECAVNAAIKAGELDPRRLDSFRQLHGESRDGKQGPASQAPVLNQPSPRSIRHMKRGRNKA